MDTDRKWMCFLTAEQVADAFSISTARVYELARERVIPCVRLGRTVRFDAHQIEEFVGNGGKSLAHGWRKEEAIL